MASTTPILVLPYPDPPDSVDVPRDVSNLAKDVDTKLGPLIGQMAALSRVDITPGSAVLTAANGWSIAWANGYRWPGLKLAAVTFSLTRTGANIVASAYGHVADQVIATVVPALKPVAAQAGRLHFDLASGGITLELDGSIVLNDMYPNTTLSTGNFAHGSFVYPSLT